MENKEFYDQLERVRKMGGFDIEWALAHNCGFVLEVYDHARDERRTKNTETLEQMIEWIDKLQKGM